MEKRINIAELLKECPKGMELNCTMFDNVTLEGVTSDMNYPIKIRIGEKSIQRLTTHGGWISNNLYPEAKCVIFPKGKNTWEGFVPPCKFNDGDIVCTTINSIAIINNKQSGPYYTTYCGVIDNGDFYLQVTISAMRLATEEEKQKLFDAIKANGYRWNAENKTLEKLIKPRFKVGDKIVDVSMKDIGAPAQKGVISEITDDMYIFTNGSFMFFDSQDCWKLDPDKFDINTLVPFEDKVLVRDEKNDKWMPATWGFYDNSLEFSYTVEGGNVFNMCIPYKGNEHLLGTTNDCVEFYKNWEE